jgi:lipopolysaccharide/colanic/teichoic acid biosynthesis glycosyltransferase
VATAFAPDEDYARRIADCGVRVDAVLPATDLAARLDDYEPSDWLVIADPRCVPAIGLAAGAIAFDKSGPMRVRHLVALENHLGGTTERVHVGANGSVGRIQRYYDATTWSFTSGIACTLLPVACTIGAGDLPFESLRDLRRSLAERGVPSSDVFFRGGAFDLSRERDLLALSERLVLDHFSAVGPAGGGWLEVGAGAVIDASARVVGPVIVHSGAVIAAEATVIGPAVIGSGAQVQRDATVAQCVVGPGSVVAEGQTLRHRAVYGPADESAAALLPSPSWEPSPAPFASAETFDRRGQAAGSYPLLKAAFDVAFSAVALVLLSPLLLLIAVLVKFGSKGPALYRDRREGKDGRVFECLKFRTMCAGADALQRDLVTGNEVDGPQFKMKADPRVTRVGHVLRQLNLDELPQLFNVLFLEMSLVGPRPSPFRENQMCIPWRDGRLSVRPGVTGLWQVCRHHRAEGDFHQWIQYDLLYVRHMSFLVDLKILAATIPTQVFHRPAPLSWIVPPAELDGPPAAPVVVKVRATPALTQLPVGSSAQR